MPFYDEYHKRGLYNIANSKVLEFITYSISRIFTANLFVFSKLLCSEYSTSGKTFSLKVLTCFGCHRYRLTMSFCW